MRIAHGHRVVGVALALLLAAACGPVVGARAGASAPAADSREGSQGGDAPAGDETQAPAPASQPTATASSQAPPAMQPLLEAHNRMREAHCAPPLSWSEEIAEAAQGWADRLASRGCAIRHSQQPYGENIAAGTSGALDAQAVAERWYREKRDYDFDAGGFAMETGHFTQLVWAGTRELGCGTASCQGLDIWVCMYDPPGNMRGGYRDNVLPSSCAR